MLGLFCFQAEVDKNIELLRKKDEELSSALEKMENQSENNDIDENQGKWAFSKRSVRTGGLHRKP